MAQFRAYRNSRPSRNQVPFLLDVQSDLVNIATRLVVPLVLESEFGSPPLSRLNPVFTIEGLRVVASSSDLGAVPQRDLREPVADLSAHRSELLAAFDFLLHGV